MWNVICRLPTCKYCAHAMDFSASGLAIAPANLRYLLCAVTQKICFFLNEFKGELKRQDTFARSIDAMQSITDAEHNCMPAYGNGHFYHFKTILILDHLGEQNHKIDQLKQDIASERNNYTSLILTLIDLIKLLGNYIEKLPDFSLQESTIALDAFIEFVKNGSQKRNSLVLEFSKIATLDFSTIRYVQCFTGFLIQWTQNITTALFNPKNLLSNNYNCERSSPTHRIMSSVSSCSLAASSGYGSFSGSLGDRAVENAPYSLQDAIQAQRLSHEYITPITKLQDAIMASVSPFLFAQLIKGFDPASTSEYKQWITYIYTHERIDEVKGEALKQYVRKLEQYNANLQQEKIESAEQKFFPILPVFIKILFYLAQYGMVFENYMSCQVADSRKEKQQYTEHEQEEKNKIQLFAIKKITAHSYHRQIAAERQVEVKSMTALQEKLGDVKGKIASKEADLRQLHELHEIVIELDKHTLLAKAKYAELVGLQDRYFKSDDDKLRIAALEQNIKYHQYQYALKWDKYEVLAHTLRTKYQQKTQEAIENQDHTVPRDFAAIWYQDISDLKAHIPTLESQLSSVVISLQSYSVEPKDLAEDEQSVQLEVQAAYARLAANRPVDFQPKDALKNAYHDPVVMDLRNKYKASLDKLKKLLTAYLEVVDERVKEISDDLYQAFLDGIKAPEEELQKLAQ